MAKVSPPTLTRNQAAAMQNPSPLLSAMACTGAPADAFRMGDVARRVPPAAPAQAGAMPWERQPPQVTPLKYLAAEKSSSTPWSWKPPPLKPPWKPPRYVSGTSMFNRDTAVALLDALIEKFGEPRLQGFLARATHAAADDDGRKVARELILGGRFWNIVKKFEFPSAHSAIEFLYSESREDARVASRFRQLEELMYRPAEPSAAAPRPRVDDPALADLVHVPRRRWEVVGGTRSGGLLVRQEKDLLSGVVDTAERPVRLATGAEVEEIDFCDNRLHYRLIKGQGPASGWVSVSTADGSLLRPMVMTVVMTTVGG